MMFVHVQMYKFKNELSKMGNMVKAKEMLEALPGKVEWVQSLEAGLDLNKGRTAYDLCLHATFKIKDHLIWFKAEAATLEAFEFLKEATEESHVVEYEIEDEE